MFSSLKNPSGFSLVCGDEKNPPNTTHEFHLSFADFVRMLVHRKIVVLVVGAGPIEQLSVNESSERVLIKATEDLLTALKQDGVPHAEAHHVKACTMKLMSDHRTVFNRFIAAFDARYRWLKASILKSQK